MTVSAQASLERVVMSDRTKLTLVSLTVMMLPYRIDFPLSVLLVTAIMSTAIVVMREIWGRMQVSRKFMAALSLSHNLKSRPLLNYKSATEVIPRSQLSSLPKLEEP